MKKKKLFCRIFGCTVKTGYSEYFKAEPGAVDGIGRLHVRLVANCDVCGCPQTVGYIHAHENGQLYGTKKD